MQKSPKTARRHLHLAWLRRLENNIFLSLNIMLVSCLESLTEGLESSATDHYLNLLETCSQRKLSVASFEIAGIIKDSQMLSPALENKKDGANIAHYVNASGKKIPNTTGNLKCGESSLLLPLYLPPPSFQPARSPEGLRFKTKKHDCTPITWGAVGPQYSPLCYVSPPKSFHWPLASHFIVNSCFIKKKIGWSRSIC